MENNNPSNIKEKKKKEEAKATIQFQLKEEVESLLVVACENHRPPLEGLSSGDRRDAYEPLTTRVGEGWRVKHGHHTSEMETNSRARVCHAPMRGRRRDWGKHRWKWKMPANPLERRMSCKS
jgi:hypothetical protein